MRWLMLVVCLGVPMTAAAQVFQWQDADGRTHYGDSPPADAIGVRELDGAGASLSTVGGGGLREGEQAIIDRLDAQARERASRPQVINPPPTVVTVQPPPAVDDDDERVVIYRDRPPYYYRPREPWLTFQWGTPRPPKPVRPRIDDDDRPLPWPTRPPARPSVVRPSEIGVGN